MGRRVLNRRDLRAAADAVERRDASSAGADQEVEEEEDDDEEAPSDGADAADAGSDDDGEEVAAKPKGKVKAKAKKKAPAKPKVAKPRKPRATKKTARMRVIWGVFNNSHSMVKSFPYPQKAEADAWAKQLMTDKKQTHFVNAVKEPIEEKKEE